MPRNARRSGLALLALLAAAPAQAVAPTSDPEELTALAERLAPTNFDTRRSGAPAEFIGPGHALVEARRPAIEAFRANLPATLRDSLRYEINTAGVPKVFFNYAGPLSTPATGAPEHIARAFLETHTGIFGLLPEEVTALRLMNTHVSGDTTFLSFEQTIGGLRVFGAGVQVVVSPRGEVMSVNMGDVLPGARLVVEPTLAEERALALTFEYAGAKPAAAPKLLAARAAAGDEARFANPFGAQFFELVSDLRVLPVGGAPRLAWHVFAEVGPNARYELLLDAHTGELLFRWNLYVHAAQGTVFTQNPARAARQLASFVGNTTYNTAAGWMNTSTVTTGNNVAAYLDRDNNNAPDADNATGLSAGRASSATQDFTFPWAVGDPQLYRPAAVSNLFYLVNAAHDFFYSYGFNESAGNFQTNNYGRGGTGNDAVLAEAQDGILATSCPPFQTGTNCHDNANFSFVPDGQPGRMQMYLFTRSTPTLTDDLDGSLDGDVVMHEYGHGVSTRLVGGPANHLCLLGTQSGAMGEGWSDYYPLTYFNDSSFVVGEYVTGNLTTGIRRAAFSVPANPVHDAYDDLGWSPAAYEVHFDGEIWTATLRELLATIGFGPANGLSIEGMKYTACNPSFVNGRDGILQADLAAGGFNKCGVWRAFARHGLGASASGADSTVANAAFDLPAACAATAATILSEGAESGAPSWSFQSLGSAFSIETSVNSHTGTKRFKTNVGSASYVPNTNAAMISPSFSLAGKQTAWVSFAYKHSLENMGDYFLVDASGDGGFTWTEMARFTNLSPGWTNWATVNVGLARFTGSTDVKIRFRLLANGSATTQEAGVFIDTIAVKAQ